MAGNGECVKLVIPCHPKYVAVVRLALTGVAARTDLTVDDIEDVKVAVSEACTNVIDHAFADEETGDKRPPIEIVFYPRDEEVLVEVTDEGSGFDPKRVVLADDVLGDKQGGLGLYLMQRLMDKVEVQSAPGSGTKIKMIKRASR